MKLISYASSSKGNCHILQGLRSSLMLDCGLSSKALSIHILNSELPLSGILVTHIHGDHAKGLLDGKAALCGNKIYSNSEVLNKLENISNYYKVELPTNKVYNIGEEWSVLPFIVPHDAVNYAYIIRNNYTKEKVMYLTDVGKVDQISIKADIQYFIIEANYNANWYTEDKLEKLEYGELVKYKRLISNFGHISVQQCTDFLNKNMTDKAKKVILVHISHDCNDYLSMQEYVSNNLNNNNISVKAINNQNIIEETELK